MSGTSAASSSALNEPVYILAAYLTSDQLTQYEAQVLAVGLKLSFNPQEARIFVGKISQKKRAAFELRRQGILIQEQENVESSTKKRKLQDGSTSTSMESQLASSSANDGQILVVKLEWLDRCTQKNAFVSPTPFVLFHGQKIEQDLATTSPVSDVSPEKITYIKTPSTSPTSARRNVGENARNSDHSRPLPLEFAPRRFRDQHATKRTNFSKSHPALKRATTSEQELIDVSGNEQSSVPPPAWMLQVHPRANYACTRSTPADPINKSFIQHLHQIKEARLLTGDEIGVRAYSTSIAALSAYPYKIQYPSEITRLPGCNDKIAALWLEWYTSAEEDDPDSERHLEVTDTLSNNEDIKCLKTFFDIWGVGSDTARKFYYDNGWKDLDDVVEYGWTSLNRVQQIGVKFYEDFKVKIPREEVQFIADTILRHARMVRGIPQSCWSNEVDGYRGNWTKSDDGRGDPTWDPRDMVCVIVGGYRRGKVECGDVDVIVSHKDEELTKGLIVEIVGSLEDEGWITHTLSLHTTASNRDQQTLPHRTIGHAGHGFDTLDKALCVWQDPRFDQQRHGQNPNTRRRVDIIISPWRTVGAAVLGWSGATTFERDIRKWATKERGWKFDSSGLRDRVSGKVIDLESPTGKGKAKETELPDESDCWEDRERRLMEGLGIGWRPATERCTG